ncbi:MAG: RagB/SusD family nutrient uptake outer membrane protein, partial [Prevotellaceae bacterium]|nr:RagB/SusD family nutrient uptake outer membrane protein [Prevotellaceae bacterium]
MKKTTLFYACAALMLCGSCSDFMDTYPYDALSPATTWQTEDDAEKFLVGCYEGWLWGEEFVYLECTSDIGFNYHTHEGWRMIGDGTLTAGNPGNSFYSFTRIRRCVTFLENIDKISFSDESKKKDLIAQARVIRAYDYFKMNFWYGGVPIITEFKDADEAKVPKNTEKEVIDYIYKEIDLAVPDLNEERAPKGGRIRKGAALALKMRSALYWGDYQRALDAAKDIKALGQYELDNSYANLFTLAGRDSKEIILSVQHLMPSKSEWLVTIPNNADGGWSSMVPTQNLIDMYEMADGKTKEEAGLGYDPTHPFAKRDPRMAMTVLYPGQDWASGPNGILNTLVDTLPDGKKNPNYPTSADNASKTGLTWAKYVAPLEQYNGSLEPTEQQQIVFRYAEVLLTIAEASN